MSRAMTALDRARDIGWYHTLELTPELTTQGLFDLRPYVHHYGLPERLDGMRCLDIGTWDGFWLYEMERRGAAEVVGLDIDDTSTLDWPPRRRPETFDEVRGEGFHVAKEILGSKAERVVCNLYDATPERLGGTFDLVFCGSVLIHLRDQLLALERIAGLCHGQLISAEEYDRRSSLLPWPSARYLADREKSVVFWLPAKQTWKRLIWSAGFDHVEETGTFDLGSPHGFKVRHVVHHARKT
jgi:tRNA (mo5U34)-methyltransferase